MLFDIMEQHFTRKVGRPRCHVKSFGEVKSGSSRRCAVRVAVAKPSGSASRYRAAVRRLLQRALQVKRESSGAAD